MGVPGDEDGGGLSAFVVFSQMGFYPLTPGSPTYNIGSPVFKNVKIKLRNGKVFEIDAIDCSEDNKYIQSATLNGEEWDKPWFSHKGIENGGKLVLKMGDKANMAWGASVDNVPPSAESNILKNEINEKSNNLNQTVFHIHILSFARKSIHSAHVSGRQTPVCISLS